MDGDQNLSDLFEDSECDIFSILDALEGGGGGGGGSYSEFNNNNTTITITTTTTTTSDEITGLVSEEGRKRKLVSQKSTGSSATLQEYSEETDQADTPSNKRQNFAGVKSCGIIEGNNTNNNNQQENRISHITVERNRRKQMNEHLSVLRSLMPCFYAKRGDQASIIGGVVDYINELQQVLQSLEAKKQRKVYSEVLSPRLIPISPRVPSPLSPRKPPLSPRMNLPISPRTPQPTSPYKPNHHNNANRPAAPITSSNSSIDSHVNNELAANSKSTIADVEVKFSGANVILKTVSPRIPGQAVKIIAALEELALEILHVSISTIDGTMLNSFTIKIGIECQLSAEELAHQIQQTFC
ncbi:Transcription factor SPEECHLESS [Capsicum baccatum]|uniref:Transcription factor SPEECHLESS n=1 Tax=Capsicum baccatum TaxID=33114 RepID=A0A2G2X731_CAPBA|nr:Transcription factor SPEECHLESS [Capsicum baccatum]